MTETEIRTCSRKGLIATLLAIAGLSIVGTAAITLVADDEAPRHLIGWAATVGAMALTYAVKQLLDVIVILLRRARLGPEGT